MKELVCGPRGRIEQLFEKHAGDVRHNSLEPTRVLAVESIHGGRPRKMIIAEWACHGLQPDVTVGTVLASGPDAGDGMRLNCTFDGATGCWRKDILPSGTVTVDPACTDFEYSRAPLDAYDFACLDSVIATAQVANAIQLVSSN